MIRLTQVPLPISHTQQELEDRIRRSLRSSSEDFTYEIVRRSLDARDPQEKIYRYTIDVNIANEKKILRKVHNKNVMSIERRKYHFPKSGEEELSSRPVVVGSGPAGLFAGWYLARAGYRPLIIERGQTARERQKSVETFWQGG
ncbi:MAG: NAD(P)-binding protein [Blautia sp.]